MKSGLLGTKLRRPTLSPAWVPRPHLASRLNDGLELGRQITLVSAPAGFGKTSCVSEWLDSLDIPIAWLSLDPADDDPGQFFTYLIAALQTVNTSIGQEIKGVLRAGQLPPGEIIYTNLINDILDVPGKFMLALDDFQVIQDGFILQVLEKLVTNQPQALHLVLLTREDPPLPLARLRANNQLTEIRAHDLRFSAPEAERYLNERLGLSLSQAEITALEERTEGWIAGLHLAGLSVRDRSDPSSFIASLSGSQRFILSYLTEEVLSRQPDDIQQFLLQTSILDRLNGDLCDAVTGRADSHLLLPRLYNANLFLVALDEQQHWYRYHQLFADMLRDLAARQPITTADLHRRASRWYAQAGAVEGGAFISQAILHSLQAGDYAMAVHLIESHAMDMLMQWHVKTVEGWMQSIPADWCAGSPSANLAFAWVHLSRGDHQLAVPYFQRLGTIFSGDQAANIDPRLKAKWLALQSMLLNAQGKPTESLETANQALDIVPPDDGQVRSMIYLGLANAYQQMDDYDCAVEAFQMIIQLGQTAGNSVYELLGISGLALLVIQHGHYRYAFQIVSQGVERIERSGTLPPISTALYGELGVIHYQWHQLEQAHHYFLRAIQVSALSGYSDAELFYGVILSRLHQIQGDLQAADREIQKAVDLMLVEAPAAVREEVISQRVRIDLALDRLTEAEIALQGYGFSFGDRFAFPGLEPDQVIAPHSAPLYISALHILLYRARALHELDSLEQGIELADRLIDGALQRQYIPFALEALLLRAQLYSSLGENQPSQEDYLHALQLGEPERLISIFVEGGLPTANALSDLLEQGRLGNVQAAYVRDILAAFPRSQQARSEPGKKQLIEPLTDREREVLHWMAEGLKYGEIAARLYISLNTVRSHVKAIYGKLSVNNRAKAVERARQLGIL